MELSAEDREYKFGGRRSHDVHHFETVSLQIKTVYCVHTLRRKANTFGPKAHVADARLFSSFCCLILRSSACIQSRHFSNRCQMTFRRSLVSFPGSKRIRQIQRIENTSKRQRRGRTDRLHYTST